MQLYLVPLFAYVAVYALFFLLPYLGAARIVGPRKEMARLMERLREEVKRAKEAAVRGPSRRYRVQEVEVGVAGDGHAAEAVPEGGDAGGEGPPPPPLTNDNDVAGLDPEEAPALAEQRAQRVRRAERPGALRAEYGHVLVDETAAYFRARYPVGDFRRFELERLPAYATYAERLLAARNMSGLFVLTGLLGTMIKLETVVSEIGGVAEVGAIESAAFLEQMGSIMSNTGGAFLSSIYGLGLMVGVLMLVALIDRLVQRHVGRHDHDVQAYLVPALVDLHEAQNPNVSVSDLIAETGALLIGLNRSVGGLTSGMNESLAGLGDRIEKMLTEFDAFSTQYTKLSDLLDTLKASSENMEGVTKAIDKTARSLERAGERMGQPIEQFNLELNRTIRENLSTVVDAMDRARASQEGLGEELHAMQAGVATVSKGLREDLQKYLAQNGTHHHQLTEKVQAQLEILDEQRERMESELQALTEAMRAADSEKMGRTIRELNEQIGASAEKVGHSAALLQRSAQGLDRAAAAFHSSEGGTFFGWARQQLRRIRR